MDDDFLSHVKGQRFNSLEKCESVNQQFIDQCGQMTCEKVLVSNLSVIFAYTAWRQDYKPDTKYLRPEEWDTCADEYYQEWKRKEIEEEKRKLRELRDNLFKVKNFIFRKKLDLMDLESQQDAILVEVPISQLLI